MAKDKQRVIREENTVDKETGEVVRRTTVLQFDREPNYVKLYLDCLGVVLGNDGLGPGVNGLLVEVFKLASYADGGQHVVLNSYNKSIICKNTGKTMRRLDMAIQTWTKNNVLKRVARGTYQINPWLFGKGEWRDIKGLRATFDFTAGEITTERKYRDE